VTAAWLVPALAAAPLVALGAALQQNAAVHCRIPGFLKLLAHLVRRPKWVLGAATTACGAAMHITALANGPLTVVQPLGMSGLPIAVLIAAAVDRRRVRGQELAGTLAVSMGLVSLLLLLPHDSGTPELDFSSAILLCGSGFALLGGAAAIARRSGGARNALFLAMASGVAYGVFAALVRVGGHAALHETSSIVYWATALAVVFCLLGVVFQQNAYRTGRFALSYATLLVVDPFTGAVIGLALLNERLPDSFAANLGVLAACALTIAGVVILTRLRPASHPVVETLPPTVPSAPVGRELVTAAPPTSS
jgi:drug/metabolite transporter (DMT)-like permease